MQEEEKQACKKAMRLLERMDRTEKGLMERLIQAGFSQKTAEYAVAYVKDYGYLDDFRYAHNYISYRIHEKSRQRIFQELLQKGIDRETAEKAWEETSDLEEPDEREILKKTVKKKYTPGTELDEKAMRRLYGFLLRRGFRSCDISAVLEEMEITVVYSGQSRWQ